MSFIIAAVIAVCVPVVDSTVRLQTIHNKPVVIVDLGSEINTLAWREDSKRLAVVTRGKISIIDPTYKKPSWSLPGLDKEVDVSSPVCFCEGGKSIALGTLDGDVVVYELGALAVKSKHHIHRGSVSSIMSSPDGKSLLTSGIDRAIRLVALNDGVVLGVLNGHTDFVSQAIFIRSDLVASVGHDMTLRTWQLNGMKVVDTIKVDRNMMRRVEKTVDPDCVITADSNRTVKIWNLKSKTASEVVVAKTPPRHSAAGGPFPLVDPAVPFSLACSPTNMIAVVGLVDGAGVIDIRIAKVVTHLEHTGEVQTVSFSPDGKWLATGGTDGTVRLWKCETLQFDAKRR
jgi:WD40 repeat protein